MAGELWRQYWQLGKETTPGTTVAATRRMYFGSDSKGSRERAARPHKFATASRDNVRAFTLGPTEVGGDWSMPLSADELIEWLLMSIAGGVTPTGSSPYVWTFTPGNSLDAATAEWYDGARGWDMGGVLINKLTFEGSVEGENMVKAEPFAQNMAIATPTGSLAEGVPTFIEGWETKLFVDSFGGTPGSTQVNGTLINWNIEIDNMIERKYFAQNTLNSGALPLGELGVKAKLTFEAAPSGTATEFSNWDGATKRLVRLDFGNNDLISGSDYRYVKIDIPGAWDAVDLGGSDKGTRTYELGLQYVYDPTNAFGLQIIAQNDRSAAWADR